MRYWDVETNEEAVGCFSGFRNVSPASILLVRSCCHGLNTPRSGCRWTAVRAVGDIDNDVSFPKPAASA